MLLRRHIKFLPQVYVFSLCSVTQNLRFSLAQMFCTAYPVRTSKMCNHSDKQEGFNNKVNKTILVTFYLNYNVILQHNSAQLKININIKTPTIYKQHPEKYAHLKGVTSIFQAAKSPLQNCHNTLSEQFLKQFITKYPRNYWRTHTSIQETIRNIRAIPEPFSLTPD